MREAARHAPGSLEELAWGLRTGALRPRDPSQVRPWFPSRRQIWSATLVATRHGYMGSEDYAAWLVMGAWLPRSRGRWSTAEIEPGKAVAYCPPWRPRRYGIPLARVAERLIRGSRFVLDAAGEEMHNPDPRLREAI